MKKIGVLLPAYNEEKNIKTVIDDIKKFVPDSKIVVVDDGSRDLTSKLAEEAGAIILRHEQNKGKGEALKTGIKYFLQRPEVNFVLITDSDGQYSMKEAGKIINSLKKEKVDFVIGNRYWDKNWKKIPFRHRLGIKVWKSFFNFFFGSNFKDTNCGFIGLTKNAMEKIQDFGKGYTIENAMLADALRNNLKIGQVPVEVNYEHKSKILRGIRVEANVLFFILKEGIKYRLGIK